ncbi:MAG: hypothetical protein EA407_00060 [Rhodobacteraceae bacterium]|nr:MAG: hypothetical protein EA407_00060 [Paracoccaceae bacterium]
MARLSRGGCQCPAPCGDGGNARYLLQYLRGAGRVRGQCPFC